MSDLDDLIEQQRLDNLYDDDFDSVVENILTASVEVTSGKRGGSRSGRRANIDRDLVGGSCRIMNDYFNNDCTYGERLFRRRFRMKRSLFQRIIEGILDEDAYFEQKYDALLQPGLSTVQKAVAAIRILRYGCAYDAVDEYVRIGESTASQCLQHFCNAVVRRFGPTYFRSPTKEDLERIMQENSKRGFPGMVGSIDCYNWEWENCPKAWHGSYKGKKGVSIVLEAAVTYDLWFWRKRDSISTMSLDDRCFSAGER
ncbi:hypothetical protein LEN26_001513 [Aphanomyces euteiches]|nr:hypothetical protein AeMF1_017824 [Aphanomyces euteiches]KAH9161245.1 hypothetical protein LEN26_001513 [Aphanomyces euteiches]